MSTSLKSCKAKNPLDTRSELTVCAFSGGTERGRCMQLTQMRSEDSQNQDMFQYVQLDEAQVVALAKRCADFLGRNY